MIHLFKPHYEVEAIISRLRSVLESGWTGKGALCAEVEQEFAKYIGEKHRAIFVNSCTSALHLAVRLSGLKPGTLVLTTPLTFVATAAVLRYEGLEPIFGDVDEDTLCLSLDSVKRFIGMVGGVMVVHYGGTPAMMEEITPICKDRKVVVIEDCAHAMGGEYIDGGKIGAGNSFASCFSFHSVKNLPSADSGMLVVPQDSIYESRGRKLSWFGIDRSTYERTVGNSGLYKWQYDINELGYKYNANDIMAAIVLEQLKVLDQHNERRRFLYERYAYNFANTGVCLVADKYTSKSSRHLCVARVPDRDDLILRLNNEEIYPGVHYRLLTEYAPFKNSSRHCPVAERLVKEIISLPLHVTMTEADVDKVSQVVIDHVRRC